MKTLNISVLQHAQLRAHPEKKPVAGWLLLADRNHFKSVLLVSAHRPLVHVFHHEEPYHSYLKAQMLAEIYALDNPEVPPAAELKIQPLMAA